MKSCSNCNIEKPLTEFHKRNASEDGAAYCCKACVIQYKKAYYSENSNLVRQQGKAYRERNAEAVRVRKKKAYHKDLEFSRRRSRESQQKLGPEHKYLSRIKREYGLTAAEFTGLKKTQNGCCALCGDQFLNAKNTHIDHIHGSDPVVVRGILCNSCNVGLGYFKDSPERLASAIAYLKKFQK